MAPRPSGSLPLEDEWILVSLDDVAGLSALRSQFLEVPSPQQGGDLRGSLQRLIPLETFGKPHCSLSPLPGQDPSADRARFPQRDREDLLSPVGSPEVTVRLIFLVIFFLLMA